MRPVAVAQEQIPPAPLLQRGAVHCSSASVLLPASGEKDIVPGNDQTNRRVPRLQTRRAAHRTCAVFRRDTDVSSKNPGLAADGSFGLDLSVFFGYFLDSHLRRSPFGPAALFAPQAAQCAKESDPRDSAEALDLHIVRGKRDFMEHPAGMTHP